jgi:glutathione S-transferase
MIKFRLNLFDFYTFIFFKKRIFPMYTLFCMPGACSLAVHAVLNELGQSVDIRLVTGDAGAQNRAKLLEYNALGQVPVLVDGDVVLREGAAILLYLLDKHKSPLMPSNPKERAQALQWLMFANATLHPAYARYFFLKKNTSDPKVLNDLGTIAASKVNDLWAELDKHLESNKYCCGDTVTAADILITIIANWSGRLPQPIVFGKNTERLLKEISKRPCFADALKREEVEFSVAA